MYKIFDILRNGTSHKKIIYHLSLTKKIFMVGCSQEPNILFKIKLYFFCIASVSLSKNFLFCPIAYE